MKRALLIVFWLFGGMAQASAQYDYPPSTSWWKTQKYCFRGSTINIGKASIPTAANNIVAVGYGGYSPPWVGL